MLKMIWFYKFVIWGPVRFCWIELWCVKESTRRRVWSLDLSGGADALSWTWHYETKYESIVPISNPMTLLEECHKLSYVVGPSHLILVKIDLTDRINSNTISSYGLSYTHHIELQLNQDEFPLGNALEYFT